MDTLSLKNLARARVSKSLLFVISGVALLRAPVPVALGSDTAKSKFATYCQEEYENGWISTLPGTYERCYAFNSQMDNTDTLVGYWSLKNQKYYWENSNDYYGLEKQNLVFHEGHAGDWADCSNVGATGPCNVFTMWNVDTRAVSSMMRLGDENVKLSILSTNGCDTMKTSDGTFFTRWKPVMRGGLRYVTGHWGDHIAFDDNGAMGLEYASYLQAAYNIRYAWADSQYDGYHDQTPAAMATGTGSSDCASRRDGMTWRNFNNYSQLRDSSVSYMCWSQWTF